ncbi:unnamed protein product [Oreochromis niloticus]|nr:unnamed protein product [Mustela putorius furo]
MSVLRCFSFSRGALWCVTRPHLQECTPTSRRLLSAMTQVVPPILSVTPSRALVDEKFKVLVENLPPGCPVTVRSLHHSEDKDDWEAYGHYVSDHSGVVSVSEDLSYGGTYTGKEPMGLLWSMRPVPGSRPGLRLRKMNVCTPMLVTISVHSGHEGFRDQAPLASVLTERWYMAPGIRRININEQGVQGTLFIPPGPGPFPGLLDMWGGGGGLLESRAALLASHGYVSLALDYLGFDQESENLEFKYFEPCCIVCISCNHYYPARGSTVTSKFEGVTRQLSKARVNEDNQVIWKDVALEFITDPSNIAEVGRINCPTLLVNGCDDQNWPTVETAEDVARLMREAGKEHLLSRLAYPDTGHLIEPPFSPHFRATTFVMRSSKEKVILLWGGQTKPHSDAQEDSWRKILSFLQFHLYCGPNLKAKI